MNQKIIAIVLILSALIVIWLLQNPIGRFGYHFFGFTVYSGIPFPYFDLRIHVDGSFSIREKSHWISLEEVNDLIAENPDFLIIGIGYDELVKIDEKIFNSVNVEALETSKAIRRFNELRHKGKRVAAIIHSTC